MENLKNWYVIYTKPRYERKVADLLERKKVECYYPRYNQVQHWQEKRKVVNVPLFKSFLFVYASENDHTTIKQIDGVAGILYWLQKPAIIKDEEISTLKNFVERNNNVRLEKIHIRLDNEDEEMPDSQKQMADVVNIGNSSKAILPSLGYMLISESVVENIKIVA